MRRPGSGAGASRGRVAVAMLVLAGGVAAQTPERFQGRLSILPVDFSTVATLSGGGEVTAELRGRTLTLDAVFSGLGSPATGAEVRRAPPGRRGEVAFTVALGPGSATDGEIHETVTLSETEAAELRGRRYYLQIRTAGNPDGEIRGWLLPRE